MASLPTAIGTYRVVRQLGEGGMGIVYEGIHATIERRVAIKVLHPEYAKNPDVTARFFNEARAVNRIEHPGLVQISDYAQLPDGTAYLVMEFLKGESLAKRLERGRLTVDAAVRVSAQVADALAAAHEKGIIHRDLKPDNVMMVADAVAPGGERAKLLDFGIAKLVEAAKSGQIKTRTNMVMGTPLYMSPEQCRGAGEVDDKSDVYSLGVMLYEMLSGRGPFEAEGHGEMLARHLFTPPYPLSSAAPDIPSELAEFVHRLLSKDRAERPSMRVVYQALSAIAEGQGIASDLSAKSIGFAPTLPQLSEGAPRRSTTLGESASQSLLGAGASRAKRVLTLLLGVLVLVGVGLYARRIRTPEPQQNVPAGAIQVRGPTATPVPGSPQAAASITWRLRSEPTGAAVVRLRDDVVMGNTPWESQQAAAATVERFRLRLPGYVDREVGLAGDHSVELFERLERVPLSRKGAQTTSAQPLVQKRLAPVRPVPASPTTQKTRTEQERHRGPVEAED